MIYASGDRKAIAKLKPMFAGFSRKSYDVGAFGNGSRMKYVANLLVAINNVASAEAMVLGMKAGLDPKTIFEMISNGAGNSRVFELRAPMMVKNDYGDVTMKCSVWQKDMDVIGAFAKKMRVPTPLFSRDAAGLCGGAQTAATPRTTPRRSARCWKAKAEASQGAAQRRTLDSRSALSSAARICGA